jgi:hypothetical protein
MMIRALVALTLAGCALPSDFDRFEDEVPTDGGAGVDAAFDAGAIDAGCASAEETCDGADNDCDGIIDDGCPYAFGRPSPILPLAGIEVRSPRLSSDGLRLYLVIATDRGRVYVASRTSIEARFGAPTLVLGADLESYDVNDIALSTDEEELFASAAAAGMSTFDVMTATRAGRSEMFGALAVVTGASGPGEQVNVFLSADGTELFYALDSGDGAFRLYVTRRGAPGLPFSLSEPVVLPSTGIADYSPFLSDDGQHLFFSRDTAAGERDVFTAVRAASGGSTFESLEEVRALNVAGTITRFLFISEETGEIFFVANRPWSSPAASGLWRGHVCRDGPCIDATISCSGVRSPDLRRCFVLGEVAATWDAARTACDGSLATIHSDAERDLVHGMAPSMTAVLWLGATDTLVEGSFVWSSGEPFSYTAWATGQPSGEEEQDCLTHNAAASRWDDASCAGTGFVANALCEQELWPW